MDTLPNPDNNPVREAVNKLIKEVELLKGTYVPPIVPVSAVPDVHLPQTDSWSYNSEKGTYMYVAPDGQTHFYTDTTLPEVGKQIFGLTQQADESPKE